MAIYVGSADRRLKLWIQVPLGYFAGAVDFELNDKIYIPRSWRRYRCTIVRANVLGFSRITHLPAITIAIPSPYKVFLSLASRLCLADQSIR